MSTRHLSSHLRYWWYRNLPIGIASSRAVGRCYLADERGQRVESQVRIEGKCRCTTVDNTRHCITITTLPVWIRARDIIRS